jgi:ribosome-associated protein
MKNLPISKELIFKTSRSGGKGGQNVNKVETKVEVSWHVLNSTAIPMDTKEVLLQKLVKKISEEGYISVTSTTHRTQLENKREAVQKLHALLQKALQTNKKRVETAVPKGVLQKRKTSKIKDSEIKQGRRKINPENF